MSKISENTITNLRSIPIKDLADRLGIELGRGKSNARCFNKQSHKHGDRNGSLGFDERRNRFKCFTCGISGDTIELVSQVEGVDFKQSCEIIANLYGIPLSIDKINKQYKNNRILSDLNNRITPYKDYDQDIRLNENKEYINLPNIKIYQDFYNLTAEPNQELLDWWNKRGYSKELLKKYGWRVITADTYNQIKKMYSEADLIESGLFKAFNSVLRPTFSKYHNIVTPYFDEKLFHKSKVLYLRARSISSNQKAKYLAPTGTSPIIYGYSDLMAWAMIHPITPPLYITESETDAIALVELAKMKGKEITAIALVGGQKSEYSLVVRELAYILKLVKKDTIINIVTDRDKTGDVFFNAVATVLYKAGFNPNNLIKWQQWDKQVKDIGEHLQNIKRPNNRTIKTNKNA